MPPCGWVQRVPAGRNRRQESRVAARRCGAGLHHACAMRFQTAGLCEIEQHRLRELVGMQIG